MTLLTTTCAAGRKWNFRSALVLLSAVLSACDTAGVRTSLTFEESGVVSVLEIPTRLHRLLVENSVAVTSVTQPGIIFGMNDSGNEPLVFAVDSLGRHRAAWIVDGARNRDWESAALAPCRVGGTDQCLYIGDTGDNGADRQHVSIYRVPEPPMPAPGGSMNGIIRRPERLDVRYSDRPHDVEAMYVGRDGAIYLITKRRLLDEARRPRPALIFRVAPSAWDSSGVATASLVDSLPIIPGEAPGRQVSDAALSPDGSLLAVRTYAEIYVFAVNPITSLPITGRLPSSCTILGLEEKQGEGVGWWWDRRRIVLTSEGKNAPMFVIECALPKP